MEARYMLKWGIIISMIAVLSFLHLQGRHAVYEIHLLHQQLFFIPIILASFWFRLHTGLAIAVLVSIIFLSSMAYHMDSPSIEMSVYTQIALYFIVATLIGWLTGRFQKQQEQAIEEEKLRSITNLASALSFEIQEIVQSLEARYQKHDTYTDPEVNEEISKLKRLTRAFEQLGRPEKKERISQDLNEMVKKTQRKYQPKAKASHITLATELDKTGCPTMVMNDSIINLFEALVENAIEASPEQSKVILRSTRSGANCRLEVIDFGHGVRQEDVPRLFKPFFTTKAGGHGLTLAAGKKIMQDYEGDLIYESGKEEGSIFKLIVPRENIHKNIDGHIAERAQY